MCKQICNKQYDTKLLLYERIRIQSMNFKLYMQNIYYMHEHDEQLIMLFVCVLFWLWSHFVATTFSFQINEHCRIGVAGNIGAVIVVVCKSRAKSSIYIDFYRCICLHKCITYNVMLIYSRFKKHIFHTFIKFICVVHFVSLSALTQCYSGSLSFGLYGLLLKVHTHKTTLYES